MQVLIQYIQRSPEDSWRPRPCISDTLSGDTLLLVCGPTWGPPSCSDIIIESNNNGHQMSRRDVFYLQLGIVKGRVCSFLLAFQNWHLHFGRQSWEGRCGSSHPVVVQEVEEWGKRQSRQVLRAFCVSCSYYYPHVLDGETEAQSGKPSTQGHTPRTSI